MWPRGNLRMPEEARRAMRGVVKVTKKHGLSRKRAETHGDPCGKAEWSSMARSVEETRMYACIFAQTNWKRAEEIGNAWKCLRTHHIARARVGTRRSERKLAIALGKIRKRVRAREVTWMRCKARGNSLKKKNLGIIKKT